VDSSDRHALTQIALLVAVGGPLLVVVAAILGLAWRVLAFAAG
jgi:hypothetical protein